MSLDPKPCQKLTAQISFLYLLIIQDLISRAVKMVLPHRQHISSIRYTQGPISILFNNHDSYPFFMQMFNLVKYCFGNFRRKPGRRLI